MASKSMPRSDLSQMFFSVFHSIRFIDYNVACCVQFGNVFWGGHCLLYKKYNTVFF